MVVIRHPASGAARFLAERIESNVINAGDGTHEHPTQGLLDLLTLRDHFGTLAGKKICLCGDVLHSRVARSNIWGLTKLGAEVAVCGPRLLLPSNAIEEMGAKVFDSGSRPRSNGPTLLNVLRWYSSAMQAGYIPCRCANTTVSLARHAPSALKSARRARRAHPASRTNESWVSKSTPTWPTGRTA